MAHAVSEACIHSGADPFSFVGQPRSADGHAFTIDDQFAEAVEQFVGFVRNLIGLNYIVALERQVSPQIHWDNLPPLAVDLFGTSDVVAYNPVTKHLVIADLKFGRGIAVDAIGNTQLRYYASGAAHPGVLKPLCDHAGEAYQGVDQVDLVIIQPRAFHPDGPIRKDTLSYADLIDWSQTTLYQGVERALTDNGKTVCAGDHCRWCPALPGCDEPEKISRQVAAAAFASAPLDNVPFADLPDPSAKPDPNLPAAATNNLPEVSLTDDKLAELLDKSTVLKMWIKALEDIAHERLEAGKQIPGWKNVPKRAVRKWSEDDAETMLQTLSTTGLPPEDYSVSKPLTPAQVERRVGKNLYASVVAPHVVKTSSGTTIAPEGDPRARLRQRSGAEAFGAAPLSENKE